MNPETLSTAFAVWAAVVALIGGAIIWMLVRLYTAVSVLGDKLTAYILFAERRMTHIETHLELTDSSFERLSHL